MGSGLENRFPEILSSNLNFIQLKQLHLRLTMTILLKTLYLYTL